jgi:hypothetical protein
VLVGAVRRRGVVVIARTTLRSIGPPRAAWALASLLVWAIGASAAFAADEDGAELDIEGTWYVLIHYTDSSAADTEVMRWDDRLWVFERKGSRLEWTEYPIVVFSDRTGRFEQSSHGQQRVLHAWEPNEGQRSQIDSGLEYNTRGSKTKTLRRRRDGTWQSAAAAQLMSASTIGYHETWTISGLDDVPTFTRDDVLGSQRAESMSGRTQYRGVEIVAGGRQIRGEFARDDSRRGTFRMVRAGAAGSVGTKRSQRERMMDGIDPEAFRGDADASDESETSP